VDNAFGEALRNYRRAAGISQRKLAEGVDLDFSYVSKLENGRVPPPAADTVVAICGVLGIGSDELLALTGKIPTDVQRTVSTSPGAQKFLREAQQLGLTDEEWRGLAKSLHGLRER
jgi:transcriptional regulator with XRE-family HTH domain